MIRERRGSAKLSMCFVLTVCSLYKNKKMFLKSCPQNSSITQRINKRRCQILKNNSQVNYYGYLSRTGLHRECGNQSLLATAADRGTVLAATILVSHCLTSDCLLQKSVRRKVFNHIFYIHIHSFKPAYFNTEH